MIGNVSGHVHTDAITVFATVLIQSSHWFESSEADFTVSGYAAGAGADPEDFGEGGCSFQLGWM